MGFISYNLNFYNNELRKLEFLDANEKTVYRAKQLLKMLDDLADEGYIELNDKLEELHQGVSRLHKYLKDNNAEPFKIERISTEFDVAYSHDEIELTEAITDTVEKAKNTTPIYDDSFINELIRFCEWIGYKENTAYIFLLRDTLLPYIYYHNKKRTNIYPWLLGRKTLFTLAGKECVDDEIRAAIFDVLENRESDNFDEFCNSVLPSIKVILSKYSEIEKCLTKLLKEIKEDRIIVVESGCSGTFPMLLMSLDDRVDVRMYTTYPYLLNVYGDKVFSSKYENNRLFETLYSQDLYFRFSGFANGHFYVNQCLNTDVERRTLEEIKAILE